MSNEIKDILDRCAPYLFGDEVDKLYNYITNLQERCAYLERSNNRREDTILGLRQEVDDVEQQRDKALNEIQYIIDYGFDYDGFNTVESLKGLIDMLVDYAKNAKKILKESDDND